MTPSFRSTAWAWAEHLRGGGTTPWLEWLHSYAGGRPPPLETGDDDATAGRGPVPGAAQLELVRRLALRHPAPEADPRFSGLADVAMTRSGPGRGPARIPLLWPGDDRPRRRGAPPVDPAEVPLDELLRVGTGLFAELLIRDPGPHVAATPTRSGSRRRPWRPAFRLVGAPVTVAVLRSDLAAAGHIEGGHRPRVLVLAPPLDAVVAQVWSRRVQDGDSVRWPTLVDRWVRRDRLPPAADLARVARHWAGRVGPERVHVLTGRDLRGGVAALLGARMPGDRPGPGSVEPAPRSLSPAALDVLRRLNRVLNVRAGDEARPLLLRRATALLPPVEGAPGPRLAVPREHREWLDARAAEVADGLRTGGYAVHGELARIAPRHAGAAQPRRADVLTMVLDSCLQVAAGPR